jgi:hypothetical protein
MCRTYGAESSLCLVLALTASQLAAKTPRYQEPAFSAACESV